MTALFSLRDCTLGYEGHAVLENLSLDIATGERVAIIGPSGAGKSTLLAQLYALQPGQCSWCPQDNALVGPLSVFHNIAMGQLDRHHWSRNLLNLVWPLRTERQAVARLAAELELPDITAATDSLSGGQKQRVAIGRALYHGAPVFLGDEPVSAVDDWQAERLLAFITARHKTVILALHDIGLALRHCERIIALKAGCIVLDALAAGLTASDLQWVYD